MQQKVQPVGRPVSGSKPKKYIPKPRYDNPSLASNSVTALFQFPNMKKQQLLKHQPHLERNMTTKYIDSLSQAQRQFVQRKDQQILQQNNNNIKNESTNYMVDRRYSTPNIINGIISQNLNNPNNYNFMNHHSIKSKQSHGYNIISNFAVGQ